MKLKFRKLKHIILYIFIFLGTILCFACSVSQKNNSVTGSVASAHPLATKAGLDILQNGGNAFDAAIAVASTLNVVEPMMSGIGGYGTILLYDAKSNKIRFLNPSGRFPKLTNTDLMRAPTPDFMKNRTGPKSISTPGNLNAWAKMHDKFGSMEWKGLFESAIRYANYGYTISANTSRWIAYAFEDFSEYSQSFYGNAGKPLEEGEKLIQKDLANTFEIIATEGVQSFYSGKIARKIDRKMNDVGSFLRFDDLKENEAEWWDPLRYSYRNFDVYTASLPANSFPAFINLGLMQQFPVDTDPHNSIEYLHKFAEMTKESYKARLAFSFDPDIKESPMDSLLSDEVLALMAKELDMEKASEFVPPFNPESKNTTHFVVADQWGNVVSATQTLGNLFGSRIMIDSTGIWMNNSMAYSTFEPKGNPMDAFPGRHKLSGDCPVIIMKDGKPWAALGSPGGHTITQNVPQIIFNLIDFGMSMQEAIDAPKLAFVEPDIIRIDPDLAQTVVDGLISKGHNVKKGSIGNANGIKLLRNLNGKIISFDTGIDKRGEGRTAIVDR